MEAFRAIREVLRDKTTDKVYAHLCTLGIDAQLLRKHPLQKIGAQIAYLGHLGQQQIKSRKSLGLIQVAARNINYINIVKDEAAVGSGPYGGTTTEEVYFLEYLVPLRDIPLGLCWARLKIRKRFLFLGKVVDIEWIGGTLAETLNSDATLKQSLLSEFRLNRPIGIEVAPEPIYRCARIETRLSLLSTSMFDCLDRIGGYIAQHVTELNDRPERILLKLKVKVNPHSQDGEIVDCYMTERHMHLESKEPLKIPLYEIEKSHYSAPMSLEGTDMTGVRYFFSSVFRLTYRDVSGTGQEVAFAVRNYSDAWELQNKLSLSFPNGISR